MVELTGKELPAKFMRGYCYSIIEIMGPSGFNSLFRMGAKNLGIKLEPLYNYMVGGDGWNPIPLDYAYVQGILAGLKELFPDTTKGLSRRIGLRWWFGLPLSYHTLDNYSLSALYGDIIKQRLNQQKASSPGIDALTVWPEQIIRNACLHLIEILHKEGGMECELIEDEKRLNFHIKLCPFCLNQSEDCSIFPGLWEAYIGWLQGSYWPYVRHYTRLSINEEQSHSHFIAMEFK